LRAVDSDVQLGIRPHIYQLPCLTGTSTDLGISEQRRARDVSSLTDELNVPKLPQLIIHFLCEQLDDSGAHDDPGHSCPRFAGHVRLFNCATATFHTPSDPSNDEGMRHEVIRDEQHTG
jgi:hypothetical protein